MALSPAIRRRRRCHECLHRFTTIETAAIRAKVTVVKRSGLGEPFDREKMAESMRTALAKRHITEERIANCVDAICSLIDEWKIESLTRVPDNKKNRRITSEKIAFLVSESLRELDHIGYIRYMSVWKKFYHLADFQAILDSLYENNSEHGDDDLTGPTGPAIDGTAAAGDRP